MEKIPYLRELGVNSIELMPAYEFEECEWEQTPAETRAQIAYQVDHIDEDLALNTAPQKAKRLNCWGYKEAFCAQGILRSKRQSLRGISPHGAHAS